MLAGVDWCDPLVHAGPAPGGGGPAGSARASYHRGPALTVLARSTAI